MIGRFIFFGFLAISLKNVQALSDDDKKEILTFLIPHIAECSKEYPIVDGAIETVLETGKFDAINSCFIACVAKKVEILDDKGLISKDKVLELSDSLLSEESRKPVTDATKSCEGINEKEVSDAEKGCERIDHLRSCAEPFLKPLFD